MTEKVCCEMLAQIYQSTCCHYEVGDGRLLPNIWIQLPKRTLSHFRRP